MFCQFLLYSKVTQSYIYIHSFSHIILHHVVPCDLFIRIQILGVPVVAQWLTNPTRNHEVAGSVPALAQWVNHPALP